jgi:hypothetical protein
MATRNTRWRYRYTEAEDAAGIDFDKFGRNGFEICGLTSHNGRLIAVFKRHPTSRDDAGRGERRASTWATQGQSTNPAAGGPDGSVAAKRAHAGPGAGRRPRATTFAAAWCGDPGRAYRRRALYSGHGLRPSSRGCQDHLRGRA